MEVVGFIVGGIGLYLLVFFLIGSFQQNPPADEADHADGVASER